MRLLAQSPPPPTLSSDVRYARVEESGLREWLTYLASDELRGRQLFSEGYGLAAQYVASRLERWNLKPMGAGGSFLQPVALTGYRVTRNSTLTIGSSSAATTFKHGEHVTFPAGAGARRTLSFTSVEFLGYGQPDDFAGRDLKGKLVILMPRPAGAAGPAAPAGRSGSAGAIALGAAVTMTFNAPPVLSEAEQALDRARTALAQAATAVEQAQQAARGRGGRAGGGGTPPQPADLTTVQRVDGAPSFQITGDETLFEALFAAGPLKFADVRARAAKGEALAPVAWPAEVAIAVDHTYEAISRQVSNNVVGMVEGTDPSLKATYVMFGAHLDHVGYSTAHLGRAGSMDGCRRRSAIAQASVTAAGRTVQRPTTQGPAAAATTADTASTPFEHRDGISNGADDNASGSAALLGIARAFASGPRPRRSVIFVWHTGEESGLYGSRFNADHPVVPLNAVQAYLNLDMVGRDDCNNVEGDYANSVFVVGADRISTDLHNLIVASNRAMPSPMTLDYELNDAADPENVYVRSDHYSYAEKGIPIAFFTTGLHPDYHRVTDTVDKIRFPKLARIAQLIYQSGFSIANSERPLLHDNKGPRTGFRSSATIIPR
jgi:hypothetical protein